VWWRGNWFGCGIVAFGIGVVEGQQLWVPRSGNWNGCNGVAIGMGGVQRQLVLLL